MPQLSPQASVGGVGVGEGAAILNSTIHAGSAALGVACGTVGATGWVVVSFWLVKNTMTASPTVMMEMTRRYQYFFTNSIVLFPLIILVYFRFYPERCYPRWNGKSVRDKLICYFVGDFRPLSAINPESAFVFPATEADMEFNNIAGL